MKTKKIELPPLPAYTTRRTYEVWYFRNDRWRMRGTRQEREDAIRLAELLGYPFWAVVQCKRNVDLNSVED